MTPTSGWLFMNLAQNMATILGNAQLNYEGNRIILSFYHTIRQRNEHQTFTRMDIKYDY